MSDSPHVILSYIDAPSRILFWPMSEFICMVCPLFFMILFGYPLMGVFTSVLVVLGVKKFKKRFGKGVLEGFLYWYSVHNIKNYPLTPPSYIREYIE